jgi:hypothetical protein
LTPAPGTIVSAENISHDPGRSGIDHCIRVGEDKDIGDRILENALDKGPAIALFLEDRSRISE